MFHTPASLLYKLLYLHKHIFLTCAWTQEKGPAGALGYCWLLWNGLLGLALPGCQEDLFGIALSICSHFTDQSPAVRSGPLSLSWLLWLSHSASCTASSDTAGPCHPPFCTCRDHFQHFYPALFSTSLLASETEVGHHPHPQVPKGQNPNLCEDHGDLGFR